MKILIVGDIVGSPGRKAFAKAVPRLKARHGISAVIANSENAAGGRGLTPKLARELYSAGADAITLGDHVWDQKDLIAHLGEDTRMVRPANLPAQCPGRRWITVQAEGIPITVISLLGRVFMPPIADCPFRHVDEILRSGEIRGHIILVDMHAEATSEKIAMGRYLEGRVSLVYGTHTHVQTSDEAVLPGGTAYITDVGMTGPKDSVLGREVQPVLSKFITSMPAKFDVASEQVCLEGIIADIDPGTGKAIAIERIREPIAD